MQRTPQHHPNSKNYFKNSNSITGENIKLSERLSLPSNRLRGFERGKIGPKDGNDFIGGNYVASLNFSSDVPKLLENSQTTDLIIFLDIANVWGVDYDSNLEKSDDIKSAVGIGLDWFTPIGPLNFTLSQPLSKGSNDITESFRFNFKFLFSTSDAISSKYLDLKLIIKFSDFNKEREQTFLKFEEEKKKKLNNFLLNITPLIETFVKENSINIVLNEKNLFIASKNFDITNQIIEIVNKNIK